MNAIAQSMFVVLVLLLDADLVGAFMDDPRKKTYLAYTIPLVGCLLIIITICLCRLVDFCKERATEKRLKKDTLEIVRCADAEKQIVFARQLEQGMSSKKSKRMQRIQAEVRDLALEAEVKLKMNGQQHVLEDIERRFPRLQENSVNIHIPLTLQSSLEAATIFTYSNQLYSEANIPPPNYFANIESPGNVTVIGDAASLPRSCDNLPPPMYNELPLLRQCDHLSSSQLPPPPYEEVFQS